MAMDATMNTYYSFMIHHFDYSTCAQYVLMFLLKIIDLSSQMGKIISLGFLNPMGHYYLLYFRDIISVFRKCPEITGSQKRFRYDYRGSIFRKRTK